jgi:transaldolase
MTQDVAPQSLRSLIATGTKLWLDSIDPNLVRTNRQWGATGATSNPIIIADLLKTGRFDGELRQLAASGLDDEALAWEMTDRLVRQAQAVFLPVWRQTQGNDGYVSFEVDPLLEDPTRGPPARQRTEKYIELGKRWSAGHENRMIKVPATPSGLAALEELAAANIPLNVTLIFTMNQYCAARDAVWRGACRSGRLDRFKSVYSIFVSRVDVYTEKHVPGLSRAAQGQVGIVNAKRIWRANRDFWRANATPCQQEMVFASTGVKTAGESPWKYVAAFAGSDIQTNPPATNSAVAESDIAFTSQIDQLPGSAVLDEIDRLVDFQKLESCLMEEGVKKFADPHLALLQLILEKRRHFAAAVA